MKMIQMMKKRKNLITCLVCVAMLLSLTGCVANSPSTPAAQYTPSTTTEPAEPNWPATMPDDTQLFRAFQYNGALKVNWKASQTADAQIFWISDPDNNRFYVQPIEYDQFYAATFWIRLELTQAGRHYCDESWLPQLTARMFTERGNSSKDPLKNVTCIPYYDAEEHAALAGWILCGQINSSVPVQLALTGATGGQVEELYLAPSVANTYVDQDLFSVKKINQALEITEVSETLRSVQWEGKTYYFAASKQGLPETAFVWFMLIPNPELLQSESVQLLSVHVYTPVHGIGNPLAFHFTGSIGLYTDPELTDLAMIYVYNGEAYTDHVYLSLRWTEADGAYQCTKVVAYTPPLQYN